MWWASQEYLQVVGVDNQTEGVRDLSVSVPDHDEEATSECKFAEP